MPVPNLSVSQLTEKTLLIFRGFILRAALSDVVSVRCRSPNRHGPMRVRSLSLADTRCLASVEVVLLFLEVSKVASRASSYRLHHFILRLKCNINYINTHLYEE